jgi:lipopolysaccharide transport system ATP-binding protein
MQFAVKVENLSKSYRIGARRQVYYRTLRETLVESVTASVRRLVERNWLNGSSEAKSGQGEDFWALKDVSFEVQPGEVIGVVGRNGAGKSTLLKILSRITEPTSGRCMFRGRIGSLLEVGTGFHQELTGRENIYLNGSILGMSRREIASRFDEIVDFSEIEDFLDTPVKRYSSGMYVRLAFAVAAHLEPEILVVDEVLAVGDQRFQKKCLGKMKEIGRSGRTILFVSHNIAALESLCSRCILIDHGRVKDQGGTRTILARYHEDDKDRSAGCRDLAEHRGRTRSSRPIISRVTLRDRGGQRISCIRTRSPLTVEVEFDTQGPSIRPILGVGIKTDLGIPLFVVNSRLTSGLEFDETRGEATIRCHLDDLPLMPGTYFVDLYFGNEKCDLDVVYSAIGFDVLPGDLFGSGSLPPQSAGPIYWPATWDYATDPDRDSEDPDPDSGIGLEAHGAGKA